MSLRAIDRGVGDELYRKLDDSMRIPLNGKDPEEAVADLIQAHSKERRVVYSSIERLFTAEILAVSNGEIVAELPDHLRALRERSSNTSKALPQHIQSTSSSLPQHFSGHNPAKSLQTGPPAPKHNRVEEKREEKMRVPPNPPQKKFDRGLGILPEAEGEDLVAAIFSAERAAAKLGGYVLPPASFSPEREAARHALDWARAAAKATRTSVHSVLRESVRGWLLDPWVREHKPSFRHWTDDPGKYLAVYRERQEAIAKEAKRKEKEIPKAPKGEVIDMPAEVEQMIQKIGRPL